jgi:MFS family permease
MMGAAMSYSRWALVAFAFCIGLTVWSLGLFAPAAVLPYLHDKNGWSISLISAAVSMHFFVSALFVAAMPEIHRLLGIRGTAIAGAASVYIGFIGWAVSPLPGSLFLTAIVSGFGLACGSLATVTAIVGLGFTTDRAKALGVALNGTAIGGVSDRLGVRSGLLRNAL